MKRVPLALLALVVGGCHPSPGYTPYRPLDRTTHDRGPESAAYAAARGFVLEYLQKREGPDLGGWSVPDAVTEANMVRDFHDVDRYQVALTATKPDHPLRSFIITMHRTGGDWRLIDIEESRAEG